MYSETAQTLVEVDRLFWFFGRSFFSVTGLIYELKCGLASIPEVTNKRRGDRRQHRAKGR
jgi:hypothetical protein